MFPLPHTDKYVGICGSNLNFKTLQPSKWNEWNQRIVDQTQIPCKKNKKKIWHKGNSRKRTIWFFTFSIYLLLVIANYWTYEIIFISLPISFYICLFFIIFFCTICLLYMDESPKSDVLGSSQTSPNHKIYIFFDKPWTYFNQVDLRGESACRYSKMWQSMIQYVQCVPFISLR